MVSTLLDVRLIGSMQKLPDYMTVGRTVSRGLNAVQNSIVTGVEGLASDGKDSLEILMFPYLFPQGTGAYSGSGTIHEYVKYRTKQAFSLFTLLPQYIFMMFHLRQATLFR
jgi:hypothetical protein